MEYHKSVERGERWWVPEFPRQECIQRPLYGRWAELFGLGWRVGRFCNIPHRSIVRVREEKLHRRIINTRPAPKIHPDPESVRICAKGRCVWLFRYRCRAWSRPVSDNGRETSNHVSSTKIVRINGLESTSPGCLMIKWKLLGALVFLFPTRPWRRRRELRHEWLATRIQNGRCHSNGNLLTPKLWGLIGSFTTRWRCG